MIKYDAGNSGRHQAHVMRNVLVFAVMLVFLATSAVWAESFNGKVIGVIDANTIVVSSGSITASVRFSGLDCPDVNQESGPQAAGFVRNLLLGKEVWVDVRVKDHYNRLVSQVMVDGRDAAVEIASAGFGWYDSKTANDGNIAAAELQARSQGIGLWASPNPVAPWDFRRMERGVNPNPYIVQYSNPSQSAGTTQSSTASSTVSSTGSHSDYGFVPLKDQTCDSYFGIYVPTYYYPYGPYYYSYGPYYYPVSSWQKL